MNRPERTYLCRLVGFSMLERVARLSFVAVVACSLGWLLWSPSFPLALVLVTSVTIAVAYSYGPRGARPLKRSRLLSPVLLTTPTVLPFLIGYFGTGGDLGGLVGAPLAFLGVAFLILLVAAGAKDVTDVAGDRLIGYRSLWVDVVRARYVSIVAAPACPAVVTVLLALFGPLPPRLALCGPVIFGTLALLAHRGRAVVSRRGRGGVSIRTLSSHLQLLLVAVVGLMSFWSVGLLAIVGATVVFWFAADRWLYWSRFTLPSSRSELLVSDHAR